ncbi:MAG: outer membrane beta-barrel protein [Beijerinckiaceae bacterium]|nr:outer membrane beta-barrel protein [Beijerinckiaceae bacterium]
MRRILSASAGAIALSGAALAADLPARAPPPVYLPPPPPTWTGLYVGLNAGYTWSNSNTVNTFTANVFGNPILRPPGSATAFSISSAALATARLPSRIDGFIGGGQFGYNYQFGSWVTGLELDFQGIAAGGGSSTLLSSATVPGFAAFPINQTLSVSRSLDWFGTVRGRVGFTVWPTLLVYGTGGLAYGQASSSTSILQSIQNVGAVPPYGSFGTFSQALAGWTAGGGLEWLFFPNWSLKVEYLYYDLGRATYALSPLTSFANIGGLTIPRTSGAPVSRTTFNGNIVRVGINYHFNWGYPAPIVAKY